MEDVYADLEKIVCGKVEEFNSFLLQFQENFAGEDIKKIIDKKNELLTFCTDYVYKEYPFGNNTDLLKGNSSDLGRSVIHFQSMKYMYDRAKELDKLFLDFLDKFIDRHLSK